MGFIRAMFKLCSECTQHLGKNWEEQTEMFDEAIRKIDAIGMDGIDHIRFKAPQEFKGQRSKINLDKPN